MREQSRPESRQALVATKLMCAIVLVCGSNALRAQDIDIVPNLDKSLLSTEVIPASELGEESQTTDGEETIKEAVKEIAQAKDLSTAFRAASNRMLPSVVTILVRTREVGGTLANLDLLQDEEKFDGIGSGVILSEDGLIVTNNHVVRDALEVQVRLADGREYKGKDIRTDPSSDLAILKIDSPRKLQPATLGSSSNLYVGDWVLAIGSPFRFEQTVSAGIISLKGRAIQRGPLEGQLLQTDAAINPGNSGGALVNLDGELIGINTVIASRTGSSAGIGFAIPVDRVRWITSELAELGKVRRAKIGLRVNELPQYLAEELDLPPRGSTYVEKVTPGGPAAQAGISVGDIIIEIAEQRVMRPVDVRTIVEQLPIDQPQKVKILRQSDEIELQVTLQPRG